MRRSGGCQCGAIRYTIAEGANPHHHAVCHCIDCRRSSGAPMVGWALFDDKDLDISGQPTEYASSEHGRRLFCPRCGTGLFYRNATIFPDQTDIQSATLDDPDELPAQAQIQLAERIGWVAHLHELPGFDRYPGG